MPELTGRSIGISFDQFSLSRPRGGLGRFADSLASGGLARRAAERTFETQFYITVRKMASSKPGAKIPQFLVQSAEQFVPIRRSRDHLGPVPPIPPAPSGHLQVPPQTRLVRPKKAVRFVKRTYARFFVFNNLVASFLHFSISSFSCAFALLRADCSGSSGGPQGHTVLP
jgi:hypothetical protein